MDGIAVSKKVHLGCGKRKLDGFVHVDLSPEPHLDYVCDITDMKKIFEDGTVDEIYICHVLEHFPRKRILDVLKECNRILKVGGTIRLAVPNIEAVFERYSRTRDLSELLGLLYGGQKNNLDFHTIGYDFRLMKHFLEDVGFANVTTYDWKDFLPESYDDFSRCYLPHNDENGLLMSLNVIATKAGPPKEELSTEVERAIGMKPIWN